jgi:hypothetical protein
MKTKITVPAFAPASLIAAAALLLCAGCASTPPPTLTVATTTHQVTTKTGSATVIVTFNHPENFTDVKSSMVGSESDRDGLLGEIRDYVVEQAPRFLRGGQTLSITFNDIDMAGEFEPWRGPAAQDVRIIKDIYPPRIALDFSLKNAAGAEIAAGGRTLTDLTFMNAIPVTVFRDDHLRYEKTLLYNWLSGEVARLGAGGGANN